MRSPMPQSAVTGRSPIVSNHVARVSVAIPPGLAKPVAVFACSLVSPIPTAQLSLVAGQHALLHGRAPSPPGRRCVAPTNASSQPPTSTTTGSERRVDITSSDAAS